MSRGVLPAKSQARPWGRLANAIRHTKITSQLKFYSFSGVLSVAKQKKSHEVEFKAN